MIEIVAAAHRSQGTMQQWLAHVVEAAEPHLDQGLGVCGFLIDVRHPVERWASSLVSRGGPRGFSTALRAFLRGGFARMPRNLLEAAFRRPSPRVAAASEFAGGVPLTQIPLMAAFARQVGFADSIGVRAGDPSGDGCFVGAFTPKIFRTTVAFRRRWSRVGAHLTAAIRLRSKRREIADATFLRSGRPVHVGPRAAHHVAQLREAVVNRTRSRSPRLRGHADEALELWPALVAGRWSLVDGDDGTCLALWNPPVASADVSISRLEQDVAALLAIGHSNKLVAYELGLAEGTISSIVHRVRRKLGATSRAALVAACARLHDEPFVDRASSLLSILSEGEREVVRAAAAGLSNAAIAARRGRSVRTTENMLAAAYRKLGVRSRAELAARVLT